MRKGLAIGIALTTDPERSRGQLEELRRCLAKDLGEPVTAHGMWHYHHLLDALAAGELDIVWLPPMLALRATARGQCIPIALPVRHGVSSYFAALFTRPDSKIRTIEHVRTVTAAWVDRQSASGYLFIRALLASRGVALESVFSREMFLGTHDAVAGAVLDGEVDVGATFVYLDPLENGECARAAGWGDQDVHIICHAGPIPADVIAASPRLPADLRGRLQGALIGSQDGEVARAARQLMGADAFVSPVQQHFDALLEIVGTLEDPRGNAHTTFPPTRRQ